MASATVLCSVSRCGSSIVYISPVAVTSAGDRQTSSSETWIIERESKRHNSCCAVVYDCEPRLMISKSSYSCTDVIFILDHAGRLHVSQCRSSRRSAKLRRSAILFQTQGDRLTDNALLSNFETSRHLRTNSCGRRQWVMSQQPDYQHWRSSQMRLSH